MARQPAGSEHLLLRAGVAVAAVYLGLRFLIPWLPVWIGLTPNPAPVPRFALAIYLASAVSGVLAYAASDETRWRHFLAPVFRGLLPDRGRTRPSALAVLISLPLVAGYVTWRGLAPPDQPPTVLRIQHPTLPESYAAMSGPAQRKTNELPAAADTAVQRQGTVLYQKNCRPCHGTVGDGSGPLARGLRLRPVDFRDPGTIATVVEQYTFWRAREGAMGLPPIATPWNSAMPAWKDVVADDDLWQIVRAEYRLGKVEPRRPEGRQP